jgi:hypothetical protein
MRLLSGGRKKDVRVYWEYVREGCSFAYVIGIRGKLIIPSHLISEYMLDFDQLRYMSERRPAVASSIPFVRESGGTAENKPL